LQSLVQHARKELPTLIGLLILTAGLWAFVELADEVLEQETLSVDRAVLLAMRNPTNLSDPLGPRWIEESARDFTALGGVGVLSAITLASAGFLLLDHKRRAAVFVVSAVGSGLLLSTLLKHGFDRPRPDLVPHGSHVYSASFPSGHAMMSAITYLTLGVLLARTVADRRLRLYLVSLAVLLTAAVGVSRVYLGVHWPTDVLAGWTLGGCWAIFCWIIELWLQRIGQIERASD
jgi:undecaprenyl-diphosphatase